MYCILAKCLVIGSDEEGGLSHICLSLRANGCIRGERSVDCQFSIGRATAKQIK
jgi:hypothetical protein